MASLFARNSEPAYERYCLEKCPIFGAFLAEMRRIWKIESDAFETRMTQLAESEELEPTMPLQQWQQPMQFDWMQQYMNMWNFNPEQLQLQEYMQQMMPRVEVEEEDSNV